MMFGGSVDLPERLDDETLEMFTELLSARAEYFQAVAQVQYMRVEQFKGSFRFEQSELDAYVEQVLEPRREKMLSLTFEMLGNAIDLDSVKALLPSIVAGLASQIDIELVLNIVGVEPNDVMKGMDLIREFINQ